MGFELISLQPVGAGITDLTDLNLVQQWPLKGHSQMQQMTFWFFFIIIFSKKLNLNFLYENLLGRQFTCQVLFSLKNKN